MGVSSYISLFSSLPAHVQADLFQPPDLESETSSTTKAMAVTTETHSALVYYSEVITSLLDLIPRAQIKGKLTRLNDSLDHREHD